MDNNQKSATELDTARIAQDLQIRRVQVENVVELLDAGNTVPFITRYRKERTGGLDEELIRQIQARVQFFRQLAERKQTILKTIDSQGKLTDALREAILAAETNQRLEDLYLPFKPKKKTLASTARERGLEEFALAVWNRDPAVANLAETASAMVNPEKELKTPEDVLQGAGHILAELIAETAEVRAAVRPVLWETGLLASTRNENVAPDKGLEFRDYFEFSEPVRRIPPHRVLAMNRGEKQNLLKVRFEFNGEAARHEARGKLPLADHPHAEFLAGVLEDAMVRLLLPSIEREIRRELADEASEHAVKVFARNLRGLLLQRPIRANRVLAIDPGFRTGCKLAAMDETGNLLEQAVIFPNPPQKKKRDARHKLEELIRRHQIKVIAIGNGTGCRETEEFVADLLAELQRRPPDGNAPPEPEPAPEPQAEASAAEPTAAEATAAEPAPASAPEATPLVEAPLPPPVATAEPALEPLASAAEAAAPAEEAGVPAAEAAAPAAQDDASAPAEVPQAAEAPPPVEQPEAAPPVALPKTRPKPPPVPKVDLTTLPPAPADLAYVIVNEAGASVYSTSAIGKEEFPNHDSTLRGAMSLGRRLQDPLAELVKVEPQHVGVGLYQHDVSTKWLRESLDGVVESCVNHVGVDVNTASVPLLRHVSGLNQHVARELVEYRAKHGPFRNREQLLQVPSVGPARYVQAAGFLKVLGQENPLDQTWVHPESYPAAAQLLDELGYKPADLLQREQVEALQGKLKAVHAEEVASRLKLGVPTLQDILDALARPGRDPREDLPEPVFKRGILQLDDLHPDMELKGTILNVVDFGAFVDIGLKDSGLVHISQLANRFIKSPHEVVTVGDVVTVWVKSVDKERRRVSLTMIRPGTERKPPERPPERRSAPPPREPQSQQGPPRGDRPPRGGRRPAPQGRQGGRSGPPRDAVPPQPAAAPPPRKPQRPPPRPKLSKAALEGDAPLRTFSELEAYFAAQREAPPPAAGPEGESKG